MKVLSVIRPEPIRYPYRAMCTECEYWSAPCQFLGNAQTLGQDHADSRGHVVEVREEDEQG